MYYHPRCLASIQICPSVQPKLPKILGIQMSSVGLNLWFSPDRARHKVVVVADLWYGALMQTTPRTVPILIDADIQQTGVWTDVPSVLCVALSHGVDGLAPSAILADVRTSDEKFDVWVESLEDGSFWEK